ncbi:diguanylate cyclase [Alteromonas aestuariivivens]|uniref:diguanylate cyclase n=2 Tax=Alteromonas aestuariivivens TaxID=1938339 RepID=A0A3D8MB33_9ALTE|nr:diguanylate cyclase [Alteromonas aestuariivivens]
MLGSLVAISAGAEQAKQPVTYCIDPNWMPYEAIRDGKHIGISADYLRLIGELAEIDFQLVETESWGQSLEFIEQERCMVIPLLNVTPSRRQFLSFTLPYFEAPNVIVARAGTPILQGYAGIGDRLLGVVQGYRHAEYLARYYPDIRVEYVESESEGIKRLAAGEIDLLVGSLLSVNANMNNLNVKNLIITGYAEPYDSLGFGVNKHFADLVPRLNNAIEAIPEARRVDIYKRWNNVQISRQQDYTESVVFVVLLISIIAVFYWRRRVIRQCNTMLSEKNEELESLQSALVEKNRTLEFLSSHDSVTGLYNRNYMMHKAEEEVSRFQRFHSSATLLLLELSNLDELLAVHGVSTKDNVLKTVAGICLSVVREVDIAGRWGGESFLILCPQTPISAAKVLADRLISAVNQHRELNQYGIQVAVGLAALENNETFTDWYDRTFKALYHSRRQGNGKACVAD